MRLTKPTFHHFHPIYSEHGDILGEPTRLFPSRPLSLRSVLFETGETFLDYQENDIRSVPGLPGAQPGLALQLPRTFGSVLCL